MHFSVRVMLERWRSSPRQGVIKLIIRVNTQKKHHKPSKEHACKRIRSQNCSIVLNSPAHCADLFLAQFATVISQFVNCDKSHFAKCEKSQFRFWWTVKNHSSNITRTVIFRPELWFYRFITVRQNLNCDLSQFKITLRTVIFKKGLSGYQL